MDAIRLDFIHHFFVVGVSGRNTQTLSLFLSAEGICDGDYIYIGNTAECFYMGNTDEAHANNGCF